MKTVIFGTGQYYRKRASQIANIQEVQICAFLDNNPDLSGKTIQDIPVFRPDVLSQIEFDCIVLMSIYADEMRRQLLALGIQESKIMFWQEFRAKWYHGTITLIPDAEEMCRQNKKVLIATIDLKYDGSSLAAVYAAKALKRLGYPVVIAAPEGNPVFIEEYVKEGVTFAICPAFPYLYQEEIAWVQKFDAVIVNVFPMLPCAFEISRIGSVMWWIHEVREAYECISAEFRRYLETGIDERVDILAVSRMAADNLNQVFPDRMCKIMPFGIPDEAEEQSVNPRGEKLVFAMIGPVCPRKAQKEFVTAVSMFAKEEIDSIEFWMIGRILEMDYYEEVKRMSQNYVQIKFMGEKTRGELQKIFAKIDVLVCPSLEETMSITMVEGMMHRKICITTDMTGIAEYMQDGKNGYVCQAGNSKNLYEVMKWVKDHYGELDDVREAARKTYEKYFTLEKFAERLEQEITSGMCLHTDQKGMESYGRGEDHHNVFAAISSGKGK